MNMTSSGLQCEVAYWPRTAHGTRPKFSAQELVPESRTRNFARVSCVLCIS